MTRLLRVRCTACGLRGHYASSCWRRPDAPVGYAEHLDTDMVRCAVTTCGALLLPRQVEGHACVDPRSDPWSRIGEQRIGYYGHK